MITTDDTDTAIHAEGEAANTTTGRKRKQPPKRHLPIAPDSDPRLAGPPPAAPAYPTRYEPELLIASVRPSPTNPRKRFAELEDLAASIRQHGVQQAISVRELRGEDGTDFEIIFGERRWRAAKLAGVKSIPATVVTGIPDDVVVERQIVENLQRKDVDPLDEAFGFRQLRAAGRDVDYIAEKTGKSRAWIYSRLQLCDLPETVRDHLTGGGKLLPSVALLIARIPDPAMQVQATREVLRLLPEDVEREAEAAGVEIDPNDEHMRRLDELSELAPRVGGEDGREETVPMTVREASEHIQKHYMQRLEHAPFPLDDESLPGGACTKCIHRTGNQVELFHDVKRPDVCTNPPCFAGKKRAAFERETAAAAEEGVKVLSDAEARKVFHEYSPTQVANASPYVELDQRVPYELLPPNLQRNPPTYGELLGKKAAGVPKAVAQDAEGGRHDLIDKGAAIKVLRESGKLPEKAATSRGGTSPADWQAQEAKRLEQVAIAERAFDTAATSALAHVRKTDVEKDPAFWRWLLGMVASGHIGPTIMRLAGVKSRKELDGLIAKTKTVAELRAILVLLLLGDAGVGYQGKPAAEVLAGFKLFKADFSKVHADELGKAKAAASAVIKWNGQIGKAPKGTAYRVTRSGDGWQWKTKNAGALPFDTIEEAKASAEAHAGGKGQAAPAAAKTKTTAKAAPKTKPSKKSAKKKAGRK